MIVILLSVILMIVILLSVIVMIVILLIIIIAYYSAEFYRAVVLTCYDKLLNYYTLNKLDFHLFNFPHLWWHDYQNSATRPNDIPHNN